FEQLKNPLFDMGIFPLTPFLISLSFRIFGISDFAVIAVSFFFFVFSLVFTFLLAKKIFKSSLIAFLSVLAVGFNYNLIDYATSGASEVIFIAEILLVFYLLSFKKKITDIISLLVLILMYFTRAHAFIYIAGAILYWLLLRFEIKKAFVYFSILAFFGLLFDYFVLSAFAGKFFVYSILRGGKYAVLQHSSSWAVSDTLRGLGRQSFDTLGLFKKVFYNLYNFYKLMPQIMSPYFFAFFVIGLFLKSKSREEISFKIASIFIATFNLLVVAASIPFYRYIHPVIPIIYIIAVGTLIEILNKLQITRNQTKNKLQETNYKRNMNYETFKIGSWKLDLGSLFMVLVSCLFVILFGVGQTLGAFILDRRFERKIYNLDKPPVYVLLSKILKDNTDPNQVVLTNLDTWGSWYGERKTVWFPLEPKMIINSKTGEIPFDVIYLINYKMDDPNYYMGKGWRMIFENPQNPKKWECEGCEKIAEEYTLKGIYEVDPSQNYERIDGVGILLVRKNAD
ncbi:MAG: hypothetical protein ACPLY7_01335, partial [Microgenomates group bacterium]